MSRTGFPLAALSLASASVLLVAGCSQSSNASKDSGDSAASASAATAEKPAPFSKGTVKVALVRQSGAGDYFEQWGNGAKAQAKALGIDLTVYDAQADNAKQATDLSAAINSGAQAIIVDHGFPATIQPEIDKAVKKGIKVVVYDVETTNDKVVSTKQDDASMASAVLDVMAKELGKDQKVGYVNVAGYAALDKRDSVWKKTTDTNGWKQAFKVGKVTDSTATDNVPLVSAALTQHSDVTGIFAPYDELAKGTVLAVQNKKLADKVKVFGADVSNADIQAMTEKGSPWVATAGTDPSAVGAAVVRTTALELAGQLNTTSVEFPAVAITQDFLRKNKIENMDQLREALPALNLAKASAADWIPNVAH
ncbi:substrate-binding domain-containing protein [Streptomyces himalayensis]|uniref:Substrate-binding domain-containing protein n=1 Tax=Streptomyces himalayensis subsp. himalayensis TaxID=2756131 RepID=A0A7W0DIC4_9ACTN|nr:substrate-binding domain-containing protein [Streptomyces himalayensis]MBA2945563.1 substrate-binding domain-containing protein [Streptomyces himalayensis subsp. himalayensis]